MKSDKGLPKAPRVAQRELTGSFWGKAFPNAVCDGVRWRLHAGGDPPREGLKVNQGFMRIPKD